MIPHMRQSLVYTTNIRSLLRVVWTLWHQSKAIRHRLCTEKNRWRLLIGFELQTQYIVDLEFGQGEYYVLLLSKQ